MDEQYLNCIGCGKPGCDGKTGCEYYESIHPTQDHWQEEFDKAFPCIDTHCDNNGVTWNTFTDGQGELDREQQQCQYCHEVRFPQIAFIQSVLEHEREEVCEVIKQHEMRVSDRVEGMSHQEKVARYKAIGFNEAIGILLTLLQQRNDTK